MQLNTIFLLLILFQIKHFVADYILQTPYMLKKFLPGDEYILPLLAHTAVHALATFTISIRFTTLECAIFLALLDLVVHFIMDRVKASPYMLGKYKALTAKEYSTATEEQKRHNQYFWYSLGLDQGVHHLTHYLIIFLLVT